MLTETETGNLLVLGNSTYFDPNRLTNYLTPPEWEESSNSIDHVSISHVLEYITGPERVFFINELWRVLKPGGKATLYVPYWSSVNSCADPYLAWPPVTEMSLQYLVDAEFRKRNHLDYPDIRADFHIVYGYTYAPEWHIRSDATRDRMVKHNLNIVQELVASLTKVVNDA